LLTKGDTLIHGSVKGEFCTHYVVKKLKKATSNAISAVRKQSFITGAMTLAVAGIICRLIGIAFRIPLANIVKNYGMGLYQMVFPLYALLLIISSAGIPVAISKMVADRNTKTDTVDDKTSKPQSKTKKPSQVDNYTPRQILVNALILLGCVGLVISVLFLGLSHQIASLQGNPGIGKIYMAIAPAVFFVCLIAAFRGYFQGLANMLPTATSQIVEQVVKVGVGLTLAITLFPLGVYWAVFGAILAVTASELIAFGYLVILYLFHRRRLKKQSTAENAIASTCKQSAESCLRGAKATRQSKKPATKKSLIKKKFISAPLMWLIVKKSFPITLMASVFPLILVFDSLVVVNMLQNGGSSSIEAIQLYGISSGTVHTLINMPAVLGIAIGTAVIPMTAALLKRGNTQEFKQKSTLAIKLAIVISLFFALFYVVFAKQIILLLYESAFKGNPAHLVTATNLLKIESAMILLMGLSQVFTSMLQGAGKAKWPLLAILIGGAAKVAFQLSLIRTGLGIYAVSIGNVLCFGIAFVLNIIFAAKFLKLRPRITANTWKILGVGSVLSALLVGFMFALPNNKWWVILSGVVAFVVYAGLIFGLGVFDKKELPESLNRTIDRR